MSAPPRPNLRHTLPEVMTPGEVAALFRVDPGTLGRAAWDRRLRPFRTAGGHRRYRRDVVADALDGVATGTEARQP